MTSPAQRNLPTQPLAAYGYGEEVPRDPKLVTVKGANPQIRVAGNDVDTSNAVVLVSTPRIVGGNPTNSRFIDISVYDDGTGVLLATIKAVSPDTGTIYSSFIHNPPVGTYTHDYAVPQPRLTVDGERVRVVGEDQSEPRDGFTARTAKPFALSADVPFDRLWKARDGE